MKITQEIRAAAEVGMREKRKGFQEKGSEIYLPEMRRSANFPSISASGVQETLRIGGGRLVGFTSGDNGGYRPVAKPYPG